MTFEQHLSDQELQREWNDRIGQEIALEAEMEGRADAENGVDIDWEKMKFNKPYYRAYVTRLHELVHETGNERGWWLECAAHHDSGLSEERPF